MGIFDSAGDYDEDSFWYLLRSREDRALDQAVKANRKLVHMQADLENFAAAGAAPNEPRMLELERRVLALGLYARTILQLLCDKGLITSEEFQQKMRDLDLLDGTLDGA